MFGGIGFHARLDFCFRGLVFLGILERLKGLDFFAETGEFFVHVGVFVAGRVIQEPGGGFGGERLLGCSPGKQFPAASFDGGERGDGRAASVVCGCRDSALVRFLVLR